MSGRGKREGGVEEGTQVGRYAKWEIINVSERSKQQSLNCRLVFLVRLVSEIMSSSGFYGRSALWID